MASSTSVFDVARYFLSKAPLDHKKLQKLCYYAYAWFLALYGEQLFPQRFQAWIHGPVCPDLYQAYREYGWNDIPQETESDLAVKLKRHLDQVFRAYGHLSGNQLEAIAHQEEPWQSARTGLQDWQPSNNVLVDDVMKTYYRSELERNQSE